jgi:hypothetical protein
VTRALRSEGVIRNGQEEKGCKKIPEEEGRQVGQEVDSEEAGCPEVAEEEGFKVKEAGRQTGCPGASSHEPRRLRLGGVLTLARRRAR